MFKNFFNSKSAPVVENAPQNRSHRQDTLRAAYTDWRFYNDIATIVGALDRLSDRRLHMIGLHRGNLFDIVEDMMDRAEEQRTIGREVVAMLDAPVRTRNGHELTPKRPEKVEASTAGWHVHPKHSIPRFENAILSQEWTEELWDEFMSVAPRSPRPKRWRPARPTTSQHHTG